MASTASSTARIPGSADHREPRGRAYPLRSSFDLQFEWGPDGLGQLGPGAAGIVIVDVLRFTTAVSVAVDRGATVLPYRWADDGAETYAAQHNALLAGAGPEDSDGPGWSLSPIDLARLRAGTRLVLPSPNGSELAYAAREHAPHAAVLAGCLRNASAVAREVAASLRAGPVAVIAAGERRRAHTRPPCERREAFAFRPAVEDLLGAGAILRALRVLTGVAPGRVSPEARAAMAAFDEARDDLREWLLASASGRELVGRGRRDDVVAAAALDVEAVAPVLVGAAFVGATPRSPRPSTLSP
ncbi:MAG: 2-phosphosulfolactate phosphatase [Acidimicrobiales bacterium]